MIEGKLVNLRALEKEDLKTAHKWVNDRELTHWLTMILPMSMTEEEKWYDSLAMRENDLHYAIETKDGVYIGGMGLHSIDWQSKKAMLGIMIGEKEYWGKGYGTDAVDTVLGIAFDQLGLHKIWLFTYDFNERAQKSYEKSGFKIEGKFRDDKYHEGRYHDSIIMSILEDEWREMQKAQEKY